MTAVCKIVDVFELVLGLCAFVLNFVYTINTSGAAWCRLQQVRLCTQSTATTTMANYRYIIEEEARSRAMWGWSQGTLSRCHGFFGLHYIWLFTVNKSAQPFFSKTSIRFCKQLASMPRTNKKSLKAGLSTYYT